MKIKKQTRKLDEGCSRHCFELADKADVVEEIFEEYEFQSIYELEYLLTRLYTKRELPSSLIHYFTYLKGISLPQSQL